MHAKAAWVFPYNLLVSLFLGRSCAVPCSRLSWGGAAWTGPLPCLSLAPPTAQHSKLPKPSKPIRKSATMKSIRRCILGLAAVWACFVPTAVWAESSQCTASCSGSQPAWARPADGTVPPRATSVPAWSYGSDMTASSWAFFPYGDPKEAMLQDSAAGSASSAVKTGKTFDSHFYVWSREVLPSLSPVISGADLWYTVSFRFRQNAENRVCLLAFHLCL